MKRIRKYSQLLTLLVVATITMFSCVDDTFDTPPITEIPVGELYTIQQIKDSLQSGPYQFKQDASVYATVTMDNETDNSYRTFFIQDNTGAIAVYQNVSGGVYIGDSVRIYLKDLVVMKYQELFQINNLAGDGINVDENLIKQGENNKRQPEEATIDEISSNPSYYQGRLVKVTNVQFRDTDTVRTFANSADLETGEVFIQDNDDDQLMVRTSGYATFADESVPNGSGSLIAIVGQYGSTIQLYIRRISEVDMEGTRFDISGGGGNESGTGTFDDPYNVSAGMTYQGQSDVWVEGYIVGVYETIDGSGNNLTDFVPSFTSPYNTPYNLLISDNQSEDDVANCIIVQLTAGEIRDVLNLVDNATNQTKVVQVYGDLTSYFGDEGLKNTSGYWFEGDGINPEEPADLVVLGTSTVVSTLNENFTGVTADADFEGTGWLNANVQGERYWQGKQYDGNDYIQATAYGATAETIESWVVTPGINCNVNKQFSFETKVGYWKHNGLSILISSDFDGNPTNLTTSTWTDITSQCTLPTTPTDGYGTTYTPSGNIDLSSYTGQTIYILFKYVGDNSSNTTTYQIDNVQVVDL